VNQQYAIRNPKSFRGYGEHAWGITASNYQGPVILMIENYRSGLIWRLMRSCPYVAVGLHRAGFRGGWLTGLAPTAPSFESRNRTGGL
jgi:hypothetical protein